MDQQADITALLEAISSGEQGAMQDLYQKVYGELRSIAQIQRRRWQGDRTLNTTALIHEVYLKLAGQNASAWNNRSHFYATAATAMRHILVNYAEKARAAKRGGDAVKVSLDESLIPDEDTAKELLDIHEAMKHLEQENPRRTRVVECRVFGGMSNQETAEALQISLATVKRDWTAATAKLYRYLNPEGE